MTTHLGRALKSSLTTSVALVVALSVQPAHAADGSRPGSTPADTRPVASRVVPTAAVSLPGPARGRRAVELLGDQLPAAAHANSMSAEKLRHLLVSDSSAMIDPDGRLLFADPVPPAPEQPTAAAASAPLADTFALHSKPGSRRTIFLDFDGTDVSGTEWNSELGVASGQHEGWDPAGDGPAFNDTERSRVQSIWARVAEDFAPFDVDVTTQDPGAAAITRSDSSDLVFGTRVLLTASQQALAAICDSSCGGVAYVGSFGITSYPHARLQPAWVFTGALGSDVKSLAEAASHEAGHTLALNHDGTATTGYYEGQAGWAPIMGVGYSRPLVQWSRGGYAGADNTEDDLAVIARSGAPLRADEAGSAVSSAAGALPTGPAYITADADQDVYALGTCRGEVSVAAAPAAVSPNLDISLSLVDEAGTVRATADPLSAATARDRMTGLGATVQTTVPTGAYYVRVDGVGNGTALTGYDGYGSVGAYTLAASGCGLAAVAPEAPRGAAAQPGADGRSATLAWQPPADDGGSPVTGYAISRDGAAVTTVAATTSSFTLRDLRPGTAYSLTVAAVNAAGTGPAAGAAVSTPTAPGVPSSATGTRDDTAGTATLAWQAPSTDGGSALSGYQVSVDGGSWTPLGADARTHVFRSLDDTAHSLVVRAVNAVGTGTPAVVEVAAAPTTTVEPEQPPGDVTTYVDPRPSLGAPTDLSTVVDALAGRAQLSWLMPVSSTLASLTGYQVLLDGVPVGGVDAGVRTVTVTGLTRGATHVLAVRALDSFGAGPLASVSVTVPGAAPAPTAVAVTTESDTATLRWQLPAQYDESLVTGWRVRAVRDGAPVATAELPADARSWSQRLAGGPVDLEVAALSGTLVGSPARTTAVLTTPRPTRPSAPAIGRAAGGRSGGPVTAAVTWRAPASTGGSPVLRYRVLGQRVNRSGRVLQRRAWTVTRTADRVRVAVRLPARGTWRFAVRAVNAAGTSPASRMSNRVRGR